MPEISGTSNKYLKSYVLFRIVIICHILIYMINDEIFRTDSVDVDPTRLRQEIKIANINKRPRKVCTQMTES